MIKSLVHSSYETPQLESLCCHLFYSHGYIMFLVENMFYIFKARNKVFYSIFLWITDFTLNDGFIR